MFAIFKRSNTEVRNLESVCAANKAQYSKKKSHLGNEHKLTSKMPLSVSKRSGQVAAGKKYSKYFNLQ